MNFVPKTLTAGETFIYNSQPRQLNGAGTYEFYAAYQINNGHWIGYVPASPGVVGSRQIQVQNTTCSYSINPTSQNFSSNSGTGSVSVTEGSGCAWTAASNAGWITVTSGSSGSGNGAVGFAVAANTSTSSRTGTITIAGQTFTVTQSAGTTSCPSPSAIALGQTINGSLQNGDCLYIDGSLYDAYTFNGTADQQIYITLNSTQFNAYLFLFQGSYPGGTLLVQDNNGGGGTNARIPASAGFLTLPANGTYTILANSLAAGSARDKNNVERYLKIESGCVFELA